jgi:hypothetical protein
MNDEGKLRRSFILGREEIADGVVGREEIADGTVSILEM